jgi:hypothetical protein
VSAKSARRQAVALGFCLSLAASYQSRRARPAVVSVNIEHELWRV